VKTSWKSWWVSQNGPRHIAMGVGNQDAAAGWKGCDELILTVADGVGACSHAAEGSSAAVAAVVSCGRKRSARAGTIGEFARSVADDWRRRVPPTVRADYGTTCLWCTMPRSGLARFGQVGDGVVAWGQHDGSVNALCWPWERDGFQNETNSVESARSESDWLLAEVDVRLIRWVVCATDGISDDLQPNAWKAFGERLARLSSEVSHRTCRESFRKVLLDWPRPCHADDKSLAFVLLGEER
jgi:hypothetical protein